MMKKLWNKFRSLPKWVQIVSWIVLAFLVIGIAGSAGNTNDESTTTTSRRDTSEEPEQVTVETTRPTTTTTVRRAPVPEDFSIAFIETSRNCFGSAGCNVEGFPQLTILQDTSSMDLDGCIITFNIEGAESTTTEAITLQGGDQYEYNDLYVSTAGDVPLTAVITQVVCR